MPTFKMVGLDWNQTTILRDAKTQSDVLLMLGYVRYEHKSMIRVCMMESIMKWLLGRVQ